MKPFRLGLIGTGVAASQLYAPALQAARGVRLAACVNRTRSKAERFASAFKGVSVFDSVAALVASGTCDGVLVSLPIATQPAVVLEALALGMPVLSEKPVASNGANAKKLIAAAAKYRVPWLVGENFEFMPHAQRLKDWIESGKIGEVRLVEVRQVTMMDRKNPYFRTSWRASPEHALGFLSDGGVHLARVVRLCLGAPRVLASHCAAFRTDLPPMDTVLALLGFESGAVGNWLSCFDAQGSFPLVRVIGTRGCAEFWYERAQLTTRGGKLIEFKPDRDSFRLEFEHFADVVRRGVTSRVTPEAALEDLALIEQVCSSVKRVRPSSRIG